MVYTYYLHVYLTPSHTKKDSANRWLLLGRSEQTLLEVIRFIGGVVVWKEWRLSMWTELFYNIVRWLFLLVVVHPREWRYIRRNCCGHRSYSNLMKKATIQVFVATDSVHAELTVLSWDQAVVLTRLSKEGSWKHIEGLLTGSVIPSLFIKH